MPKISIRKELEKAQGEIKRLTQALQSIGGTAYMALEEDQRAGFRPALNDILAKSNTALNPPTSQQEEPVSMDKLIETKDEEKTPS